MRRYLLLTVLFFASVGVLLGLRAVTKSTDSSGGLGSEETVNTVPAMPGLGEAFDAEVKRIGQISPDEFARRFPNKAKYLEKVSWDPTTGKHWDRFQLAPGAKGYPQNVPQDALGLYDFRLDKPELALFRN